MIDNNKYREHLNTASKLGLFGAVKETIYQLISGLYLEEDEELALSLVNHLIAVGWGTGYKILGDIYNAKEIFFHKKKTLECYKKAAEMGSKSGKFKYGYCVANGIGCDKNPELGHSIIDESNCKYAYNYLKLYTKYKPKVAKQNTNCLTVLEKVAKVDISFEYRVTKVEVDPKKKNKKQPPPPYTLDDVRALVEKDIKYGIIMFNKYCWDNKVDNQITPSSMQILESVANMGSMFGNYQYGYTLYQRGKLQDCIKHLKFAADHGNYYACHFVGRALYHDSIGQYSLAKVYLKKSAIMLNDADDQYDLAFLSENDEAMDWLEMAVKTDTRKYALKVGDLFRNGIRNGLKPNPRLAKHYYIESRPYVNNADDCFRVGVYLEEGDQCEKCLSEAYYFYQQASDYGKAVGAAKVCLLFEEHFSNRFSFPEKYYEIAAKAGEKWSSHFAWNLAIHYYQMASSTSPYYHELAADYFEICGTPEALSNARQIRRAVEEYRERERERERLERELREQENKNDNSSGGGGLLLVLGVGLMLATGAPIL